MAGARTFVFQNLPSNLVLPTVNSGKLGTRNRSRPCLLQQSSDAGKNGLATIEEQRSNPKLTLMQMTPYSELQKATDLFFYP